ncbi:hypothetical protein ACJX0J_008746, partial [Zea mays]
MIDTIYFVAQLDINFSYFREYVQKITAEPALKHLLYNVLLKYTVWRISISINLW